MSPCISSGKYFGAGYGNRTRLASLEGWCITTMLSPLVKMVAELMSGSWCLRAFSALPTRRSAPVLLVEFQVPYLLSAGVRMLPATSPEELGLSALQQAPSRPSISLRVFRSSYCNPSIPCLSSYCRHQAPWLWLGFAALRIHPPSRCPRPPPSGFARPEGHV